MSIDTSLLSNFSKDEVISASSFLDKIFLKKEHQIEYSSEKDEDLILKLIKATNSAKTQSKLVQAFSAAIQEQLFLALPYDTQFNILSEGSDPLFLSTLYKRLEPSLQRQCLSDMFKHNEQQYQRLKKAIRPNIQMKEGIVIGKPVLSSEHCNSIASSLIDKTQNLSLSTDTLMNYSRKAIDAVNQDNLKRVTELYFEKFLSKQLRLSNKNDFSFYLRFFEVAVQLIILNPNLMPQLNQIIDRFLLGLKALPSDEWIAKVLNQLPSYILKKCCIRIKGYENISDGHTRSLFCKYLKSVLKYKDKYNNLKIALS